MQIRTIEPRHFHNKLIVVVAYAEFVLQAYWPGWEMVVTSTWRNDKGLHALARAWDFTVVCLVENEKGITPEYVTRRVCDEVNERFDYGKGEYLVAVDETEAPADPEKADIWGPHGHLQVRDETSMR